MPSVTGPYSASTPLQSLLQQFLAGGKSLAPPLFSLGRSVSVGQKLSSCSSFSGIHFLCLRQRRTFWHGYFDVRVWKWLHLKVTLFSKITRHCMKQTVTPPACLMLLSFILPIPRSLSLLHLQPWPTALEEPWSHPSPLPPEPLCQKERYGGRGGPAKIRRAGLKCLLGRLFGNGLFKANSVMVCFLSCVKMSLYQNSCARAAVWLRWKQRGPCQCDMNFA